MPDLQLGRMAFYKLDGDAGNAVVANVSYGGDGVISGGAILGPTSRITLPTVDPLIDYTISAWVKPTDWGTYVQLVYSQPDSPVRNSHIKGMFIRGADDKSIQVWTSRAGDGNITEHRFSHSDILWNPTNYPSNTWTHLLCTVNAQEVRLYRNGVETAQGPIPTGPDGNGALFEADGPLRIGEGIGTVYAGFYQYNGKVDDIGVWNRTLEADEITALYNGGAGWNPAPEPAIEKFEDYAAGQDMQGLSGGSGWAGNWDIDQPTGFGGASVNGKIDDTASFDGIKSASFQNLPGGIARSARRFSDMDTGSVYFTVNVRNFSATESGYPLVFLREGPSAWPSGLNTKVVVFIARSGGVNGVFAYTSDANGRGDNAEGPVYFRQLASGLVANKWYTIEVQLDAVNQPGKFRLRVKTDGVWGSYSAWDYCFQRMTGHVVNHFATQIYGDPTVKFNIDSVGVFSENPVEPLDDAPPVITLNGSATVEVIQDDAYTEEGAVALDNVDGEFAATVGGDTVDTATPGTYVVTYDATDAAGNDAVQVTRTVTVIAAGPTPGTETFSVCLPYSKFLAAQASKFLDLGTWKPGVTINKIVMRKITEFNKNYQHVQLGLRKKVKTDVNANLPATFGHSQRATSAPSHAVSSLTFPVTINAGENLTMLNISVRRNSDSEDVSGVRATLDGVAMPYLVGSDSDGLKQGNGGVRTLYLRDKAPGTYNIVVTADQPTSIVCTVMMFKNASAFGPVLNSYYFHATIGLVNSAPIGPNDIVMGVVSGDLRDFRTHMNGANVVNGGSNAYGMDWNDVFSNTISTLNVDASQQVVMSNDEPVSFQIYAVPIYGSTAKVKAYEIRELIDLNKRNPNESVTADNNKNISRWDPDFTINVGEDATTDDLVVYVNQADTIKDESKMKTFAGIPFAPTAGKVCIEFSVFNPDTTTTAFVPTA